MTNLTEVPNVAASAHVPDLIATTELLKTPVISLMPEGCLYVNREQTGKCPARGVLTSCAATREIPNGPLKGSCMGWR